MEKSRLLPSFHDTSPLSREEEEQIQKQILPSLSLAPDTKEKQDLLPKFEETTELSEEELTKLTTPKLPEVSIPQVIGKGIMLPVEAVKKAHELPQLVTEKLPEIKEYTKDVLKHGLEEAKEYTALLGTLGKMAISPTLTAQMVGKAVEEYAEKPTEKLKEVAAEVPKNLAKSIVESYIHPIKSFREKPISTALAWSVTLPVAKAGYALVKPPGLTKAGEALLQSVEKGHLEFEKQVTRALKDSIKVSEDNKTILQLAENLPKNYKIVTKVAGTDVIVPKRTDGYLLDPESISKEIVKQITPTERKGAIEGITHALKAIESDLKDPKNLSILDTKTNRIIPLTSEEGISLIKLAKDPEQDILMKSSIAKNVLSKDVPDITDFTRSGEPTIFVTERLSPAARKEITDDLLDVYNNIGKDLSNISKSINKMSFKIGGRTREVDFRKYIEKKVTADELKLSPQQKKLWDEAAAEYRDICDDLLNRHNYVAAKYNLPLIKRREDYVTHVSVYNTAAELVEGQPRKLKSVYDDIMKAIYSPASKLLQTPYAKARQELIDESMLAGAFTALEKYSWNVSRIINSADKVAKYEIISKLASQVDKPNISEFFKGLAGRFIGKNVLQEKVIRRHEFGSFDTLMKKTTKYISDRFVKSVLFTSVYPTLSQLGSLITNTLYFGPKGAIQTAGRLVTTEPLRALHGKINESFFKHFGTFLLNPTEELFVNANSKVYKSVLTQSITRLFPDEEKLGFPMNLFRNFFEGMNKSLYGATYLTAYGSAIRHGASTEVAKEFADQILIRTQAIFFETARPEILTKTVGRMLMPLSTYVFSAFSTLSRDLITAKLSTAEKLKLATELYATSVAFNVMFRGLTYILPEPIFGKRRKQLVTWYDFIPGLSVVNFGLSGVYSHFLDAVEQGKRGQILASLVTLSPYMKGSLRYAIPYWSKLGLRLLKPPAKRKEKPTIEDQLFEELLTPETLGE